MLFSADVNLELRASPYPLSPLLSQVADASRVPASTEEIGANYVTEVCRSFSAWESGAAGISLPAAIPAVPTALCQAADALAICARQVLRYSNRLPAIKYLYITLQKYQQKTTTRREIADYPRQYPLSPLLCQVADALAEDDLLVDAEGKELGVRARNTLIRRASQALDEAGLSLLQQGSPKPRNHKNTATEGGESLCERRH